MIDMRFKANFSKVRKILFQFIFLVAIFCGGYFLGVKGYKAEIDKSLNINIVRQTPPDKNVDMSLFWQVWDTLSKKYFDKSKMVPAQMVYGAIQGMVSALGDPYTMYLPPNQNKIVNEDLSGSFEGIGIEIGYKNTRLAVIAPLPGSPAEKAGMKAGDYIIHIKDEKKNVDVDAVTLPITEAVNYIRGPAGTPVILTLARDGSSTPIIVTLTREKLIVPSVALSWVGVNKNIANIKIAKFDSETTNEWNKSVSQIITDCNSGIKCKGIIVDLRNNPGGYMQSAADIASDFVDLGTVVVIQQNGNGSRIEYKSEKLPKLNKFKTVVLINGGSASASEILAGALRDNVGIKLVGDKSFGKGTIQEPLEIVGGSGLHVTTAKWLTPKGTWVHENGLTPDVLVTFKETDKTDVQLEAAIKLLI